MAKDQEPTEHILCIRIRSFTDTEKLLQEVARACDSRFQDAAFCTFAEFGTWRRYDKLADDMGHHPDHTEIWLPDKPSKVTTPPSPNYPNMRVAYDPDRRYKAHKDDR